MIGTQRTPRPYQTFIRPCQHPGNIYPLKYSTGYQIPNKPKPGLPFQPQPYFVNIVD